MDDPDPEVTTPLFNGGADPDGNAGFRPDEEAGVRVASIRGAMRFWFRALAGTVAGPDLRLLAGLERHVFGDAGNPSPLSDAPPAATPDRAHGDTGLPRGRDGQVDWLPARPGNDQVRPGYPPVSAHPLVCQRGQKFDVKLRFPRDDIGAVPALRALRLCCMYGGFGREPGAASAACGSSMSTGRLLNPGPGARSRAGDWLTLPGYVRCTSAGELARCREVLKGMRRQVLADLGSPVSSQQEFDNDWSSLPPYPVLSPARSVVGLSGGEPFENWELRLARGEQFRHFRAPEDNNSRDARYQPKIETPEWKEVVHGGSDHFKVGALGLPVVYKDGYVVNVDRRSRRDAEKLRRALPLWLRAVGAGDDGGPSSFAFLGQFCRRCRTCTMAANRSGQISSGHRRRHTATCRAVDQRAESRPILHRHGPARLNGRAHAHADRTAPESILAAASGYPPAARAGLRTVRRASHGRTMRSRSGRCPASRAVR